MEASTDIFKKKKKGGGGGGSEKGGFCEDFDVWVLR